MTPALRFLADESFDFRVVRALRDAGHDVAAIVESSPGIPDGRVLALAESEQRVLLTEDRDFGWLVFAAGQEASAGVIYLRCPEHARAGLPRTFAREIERLRGSLGAAFVVWTPRRTRIVRLQRLDDQ